MTECVAFITGVREMVATDLETIRRETLLLADRARLDLTDRALVNRFLAQEKPDAVFLAAAKVGGIHANNIYRVGDAD